MRVGDKAYCRYNGYKPNISCERLNRAGLDGCMSIMIPTATAEIRVGIDNSINEKEELKV